MIWRRTLRDSVYRADVAIVVSSLEEFRSWLKRVSPDGVDALNWRPTLGKTVTSELGGYTEWVLWFPPGTSDPTIVHESLHLCAQVLRHRGMPLSKDSEEAYAYYLESIFGQAQAAIREAARSRRDRLRMAKASLRRKRA